MDFRLPNLGEGIDAATVTAVLVKPGDAVSAGQNVVSVETDKAAVEVPAEAEGTVEAVRVKPGDKVPVGQTVLTLSVASGGREPPEKTSAAPAPSAKDSGGSCPPLATDSAAGSRAAPAKERAPAA